MSLPSDTPRLSKRSVVLATGALALPCVLFTPGRPMPAAEHDSDLSSVKRLLNGLLARQDDGGEPRKELP